MKEPHEYHTLSYQQRILAEGTRAQIIDWLRWNDPNGTYADDDSDAEGDEPLTLEGARSIMAEQIARQ